MISFVIQCDNCGRMELRSGSAASVSQWLNAEGWAKLDTDALRRTEDVCPKCVATFKRRYGHKFEM